MIGLFGVNDDRAVAFDPLLAIFPGKYAPVVRLTKTQERELVEMNWGFVSPINSQAPTRVTNFRDDKTSTPFWSSSFRLRRCLVPVTSFAEPKGKNSAIWDWFALDETRRLFAFAGIWQSYRGPIKRGGGTVEIDVYSFMTTAPNELVAPIHHRQMPLMLTSENEWDCWMNGSPEEALSLVHSYPAEKMVIVQSSDAHTDLVTA